MGNARALEDGTPEGATPPTFADGRALKVLATRVESAGEHDEGFGFLVAPGDMDTADGNRISEAVISALVVGRGCT